MKRNPNIEIKYENRKKLIWMRFKTIEKVERVADEIKFIYYPDEYDYFCYFTIIREPRKIIEEMIHQCLPDPEERFEGNAYIDDDIPLWKVYLHSLLVEKTSYK